MRKIMCVAILMTVIGGVAYANGPSGSSEGKTKSKQYNNVTCKKGTNVGGFVVYAGNNGVEACNSGGAKQLPQGRAIVSSDQGGYVAVDGDKDNKQNAYLAGYLRIDKKGPHCGKPATGEDATSPSQPSKNVCP